MEEAEVLLPQLLLLLLLQRLVAGDRVLFQGQQQPRGSVQTATQRRSTTPPSLSALGHALLPTKNCKLDCCNSSSSGRVHLALCSIAALDWLGGRGQDSKKVSVGMSESPKIT